jgi:hypothetical protein
VGLEEEQRPVDEAQANPMEKIPQDTGRISEIEEEDNNQSAMHMKTEETSGNEEGQAEQQAVGRAHESPTTRVILAVILGLLMSWLWISRR